VPGVWLLGSQQPQCVPHAASPTLLAVLGAPSLHRQKLGPRRPAPAGGHRPQYNSRNRFSLLAGAWGAGAPTGGWEAAQTSSMGMEALQSPGEEGPPAEETRALCKASGLCLGCRLRRCSFPAMVDSPLGPSLCIAWVLNQSRNGWRCISRVSGAVLAVLHSQPHLVPHSVLQPLPHSLPYSVPHPALLPLCSCPWAALRGVPQRGSSAAVRRR